MRTARLICQTPTPSASASGTRWPLPTVIRISPRAPTKPAALKKILDDGWAQDLRYLTNQDTDTSPRSDQWNNGTDMAAELNRIMKIRRAALDRFDETVIRKDQPMATMEEALVPIYMYHRYAVEAAASVIGGQDYIYAFRGDGRAPTKWVPAARAARGARSAGGDAEAFGAGAAETRPRQDPTAAVRVGQAPRVVRALYRGCLRSDQPGVDRRRRDDRVCAAGRSRGAHGRAACDRSLASRVDGGHRRAPHRGVQRRGHKPIRAGNSARHGARTRRTADVAGRRCADAAGPRRSIERAGEDPGWRRCGCWSIRPARRRRSWLPTSSVSSNALSTRSGRPRPTTPRPARRLATAGWTG